MKISKNAPVEKAEYEIESKYGLLECTFYPENTDGHFFGVFSLFAKDIEDFQSISPSFEKYKEIAMEIFAEQFPKRLEELLEKTVKDVEINTLMKIKGISLKEARRIISEALKTSERKQKEWMNAPSSGRPPEWSKDSLRKAVIDEIKKWKNEKHRNPTQAEIGKRFKPRMSEAALRMLLVRHGLEWKELKNEHN